MRQEQGASADLAGLRTGPPLWIYRWVDGALLVDLWPELDLPDPVRNSWQPLIEASSNGPTEDPIRVSFDDIQKSEREEQRERIAERRAEAARRLAERD